MPGSVLGSRDVLVSKRTKIPVLRIYILFTVELDGENTNM